MAVRGEEVYLVPCRSAGLCSFLREQWFRRHVCLSQAGSGRDGVGNQRSDLSRTRNNVVHLWHTVWIFLFTAQGTFYDSSRGGSGTWTLDQMQAKFQALGQELLF